MPEPEGAYKTEGKDETYFGPLGLETDALTALNVALGGVQALGEAVRLMEQAAGKIVVAKADIEAKHITAIDDIGTITQDAKKAIFGWAESAKGDISKHASTAVVQAVQSNIHTIVRAVAEELERRGYTS
jgi:hypothetical protein